MIYLIHFHQNFKHAKHYLGFCEDGNLEARIERHKRNDGSKLLRAVNQAGITWELAKTWDGDRNFERKLKNQKNSCKLCPICKKNSLLKRIEDENTKYF